MDKRLLSLDVFRGATIAAMILVNNPGSWSDVYSPLLHAEWHGWTFTDTIFPSFLWIVGVAMTLSIARRIERGDNRIRLLLHVLKRSAILFALGLFLAGYRHFNLATIRIPGVLQRIAVCYLIAGAIFLFTKRRGQIAAIVLLCTSYWMLMTLYPVPGCGAGSLTKDCNFARYIDGMALTGHMWSASKVWDPEGIVSTLPAIATVLFGILAGHLLRTKRDEASKTAWMFAGGNALMFVGPFLSQWMPINKSLWTVPFSIFMAGFSMTVFAASYWIVDVQGWRRWARPFEIYGMNAITVFVLSGLIAKESILSKVGGVSVRTLVYTGVFVPLASLKNASLLFAVANVLLLYLVAWIMYRRGWFVKF
jgi:predicted acyltransferase